jgi:hypothetical protein
MTEYYLPTRLEYVERLPCNGNGKARKELLRRWLAGEASPHQRVIPRFSGPSSPTPERTEIPGVRSCSPFRRSAIAFALSEMIVPAR